MEVMMFYVLIIWLVILQVNQNSLQNEIKGLKRLFRENSTHVEPDVPEIVQEWKPKPELTPEPAQQPEPAVKIEPPQAFDFEKVFLGNIFNKIGAVALIFGIGIFIKLISPYIIFTPLMKIAAGFLAGAAMICAAVKLHKDSTRNYAEVLMGTGFAALFITTYCASSSFHIFNTAAALAVSGLILTAAYYAADRNKTVSMLVIGLIGGYLNPFFINSHVTTEFLFCYLILLNALSLVFVYRNEDKSAVNFVNLLVTTAALTIFPGFNNAPDIIYPLVLWLVYLAFDVIRPNNILNWLNFGVLTLFSILIFRENMLNIGLLLIPAGLVYAGLAYKQNRKEYVYSTLIAVILSTYFLADGALRIYLWSLEGLALAYTVNKYKAKYLANWVIAFFSASATAIFFVKGTPYYLLFGVPVLSAFLSGKLLQAENKEQADILRFGYISLIYLYICFELNHFIDESIKPMLWAIIGYKYSLQSKRLYNMTNMQLFNTAAYLIGGIALLVMLAASFDFTCLRFVAYTAAIVTACFYAKWTKHNAYKYLALILGFLMLHLETIHLTGDFSHYLLSVVWILYAGAIITAGIFKEQKFLTNTGIWISILTVLKLFIFDLSRVDALYKLIAFLFLGTILMIVSYFYAKYKRG